MCTTGIMQVTGGMLAAGMLAIGAAQAAEIVGTVQPVAGLAATGISVSLQPLEGQAMPQVGAPRQHRLLIKDGRMQPAFLTLRTGDSLRIVNHDEAHHELFALSPSQPIELALDKAGSGAAAEAEVRLVSEGVWHLFCRIHSRSHARVDAVATPLQQVVEPGVSFRFEGLVPGQWQLRVAAPGAETRLIRTAAMTAPPPLRIELHARGARDTVGPRGDAPAARIDALFPRD